MVPLEIKCGDNAAHRQSPLGEEHEVLLWCFLSGFGGVCCLFVCWGLSQFPVLFVSFPPCLLPQAGVMASPPLCVSPVSKCRLLPKVK